MRYTKVFATKEEIDECRKLAEQAARTPMIALSVKDGLEGRDFATLAHERAKKRCHALALSHGLPEIVGYYGMTTDGEFVEV